MTAMGDIWIPRPTDWQKFERVCRSLWQRIWNDPNAQMHGRNGQPQAGVDVYGQQDGTGSFKGVQCKGRDGDFGKALTKAELLEEVEKAKTFSPPLTEFIVATTAPVDADLQEIARSISVDAHRRGMFSVHVYGWNAVHLKLNEHPDVVGEHWPELRPFVPKAVSIRRDQRHVSCFDAAYYGLGLGESFRLTYGSPFTSSDGLMRTFPSFLITTITCCQSLLNPEKLLRARACEMSINDFLNCSPDMDEHYFGPAKRSAFELAGLINLLRYELTGTEHNAFMLGDNLLKVLLHDPQYYLRRDAILTLIANTCPAAMTLAEAALSRPKPTTQAILELIQITKSGLEALDVATLGRGG